MKLTEQILEPGSSIPNINPKAPTKGEPSRSAPTPCRAVPPDLHRCHDWGLSPQRPFLSSSPQPGSPLGALTWPSLGLPGLVNSPKKRTGKSPFSMGKSTINGNLYQKKQSQKTNWKITMFFMGKLTKFLWAMFQVAMWT